MLLSGVLTHEKTSHPNLESLIEILTDYLSSHERILRLKLSQCHSITSVSAYDFNSFLHVIVVVKAQTVYRCGNTIFYEARRSTQWAY